MYLCIDTATSASSVTLTDGKSATRMELDLNHASERLLETIDSVIKKSKTELSDIKGVFVIKGPGSFTGLRIGIAVANQFAHQLKIPITGLGAEEWWSSRTDEKEFVYLQSMNKAEIYICDLRFAICDSHSIIPIDQLNGNKLWLGELSDEHRQKLPSGFKEITNLLSPEETWSKIAQSTYNLQLTTYNLVEPYYGKEPTITKSKKKLSI
jgi:tRNA threonylcarbamoyladenosine biosynthesis protein TsaB